MVRKQEKSGRGRYRARIPIAWAAAAVGGLTTARADVVISYAEDPNAQTSSVTGTSVYNFESLPIGTNTTTGAVWTGVGTYTNYSIIAANQYGGAGGTGKYLVESTSASLGGITTTTLTLNTPSAYFGLWWSAGDASNAMDFYNGSTLVAHFTTANLLSRLPSTYDGNPNNRTQNTAEPYAFLNFFGSDTTTWDKVVFTNNGTSGFESDNHTDRTAAWNPATDGRYLGTVFQVTNGNTTTTLGIASAVTSPVNLGNIRTNGTFASQALSLSNSAASGSAALDIAMKVASGNATASGSVTGLAAGATNNTSLRVGLNSPTVAGATSGTVAVTPSSYGIELATQTVTVNGAAYDYANPTALPGAAVALGNIRTGTTVTKTVAVGNSTITNATYQDSLDATVTPSNNKLTGTGFTGRAASTGDTTTSNLTITVANTVTAGSLADNNVAVGFVSNANGVVGLSNQTLTGGILTTTGGVYDYANPTFSNATQAFGNVHVGATKSVPFTNPAITNASYQDNLGVSVASGLPASGAVTANTISSIAAGGTAQNLVFTANKAGSLACTANLNLVSNPLAGTGLDVKTTTGAIPLTGNAYDYANPTPLAAVNFGNVRPSGTSVPKTVAVGNATVTDATYQDRLDATIGTPGNSKLTSGGSFTRLLPSTNGATTNNLTVTANIATAGSLVDAISVAYTSRHASGSGMADTPIAPATLNTSGGVYDYANPIFSNATLAFGNVRVGATKSVPFTNPAITNANYQDNLGVNVASGLPSTVTANSINTIAASGAAQNLVFTANAAGPLAATANLNLVSTPLAGATGLSGRTAAGSIPITGTAYRLASGTVSNPAYVGKVHVGGAFTAQPVTVQNTAVNDIYSEKLDASISVPSGNVWTNSGLIGLLAPGGSNSSSLSVNLTDTATAGHKTGTASVALTSNGTGTSGLSNYGLGSQTVDISGDVYRYASATVTPNPISLANVRVGSAFGTQNLTVTNTAVNDVYSEKLDAAFGTLTGSASTNGGSVSLLVPGSANTSMQVGLSTPATAGAKTGTARVALTSDGNGTSGLGTTALTPQDITINGNAYDYANPTALPGTAVAFGNVHPSATPMSRTVAVGNSTITNTSYQDLLNASVTPSNSKLSTSTGFTGLAASTGGATTSNLTLTADISNPGSLADSNVAVGFVSNANGVTGLSNLTLSGGTLTTTGGVYAYAAGSVSSPINLGNIHVNGAFAAKPVTVQNTVSANGGFSEKLDASISVPSGNVWTNSGSFTLLSPGGSNNTNLSVKLTDTATAGHKTGSASVAMTSDGTGTSGLASTSLGSQPVTITGDVYNLASAAPTATINVGSGHVGTVLTQALTLSNTAPADATYTETLSTNGFSGTTSGFLASGSASGIAGGSSGSGTLSVGLGSGLSAGVQTGTTTLALNSNEVNSSGLGTTAVAPETVTITGTLYNLASAAVITPVVIKTHEGVAASTPISVTNNAPTNATYTETLSTNGFSSTTAGFTTSGAASEIAGGASSSGTLRVGVDTSLSAGEHTGSTTLAMNSNAVNNSGLGTNAVAGRTVGITADVYRYASGTVTPTPIDLGNVRVGSAFGTQNLTVKNTAVNDVYSEKLDAAFGTTTGSATTNGGSISLLNPQSTDSALMHVGLSVPDTAGAKTGTAQVTLTSDGNGTSGLGTTALDPQSVTINGKAYDYANPTALPTGAIDFGNVRPSSTPLTQNVAVGNATITNASYQDSLNATATPTNSKLVGSTFTGLAASTNGNTKSNLTITANISTVGSLSDDNIAVAYISNANNVAGLSNQTLTGGKLATAGGVFDYATLGSTPQQVTENYGNYHVGATASMGGSVSFTNTATAPNVPYTDDLVVTGTGATGNLSGGPTQTLAANSTGATGSYGYTLDTSAAGLRTGTMTVNYTSTPKAGVTGLDTKTLATQQITASAQVYSGQSTWNASGSGTWGGNPQLAPTHANWDSLGGAPGVWSGFDNVDTAAFGDAIGGSSATIGVASPVSIAGITFNNTHGGDYAIAASGGSLALKSSTGTASIDNHSGSNTITAPVTLQSNATINVQNTSSTLTVAQLVAGTGTQSVTKTGNGTLNLTGTSTYTGTTTITQGTVQLDGALASAVDVKSGGTLTGTNGTVNNTLTLESGGTVSPGGTGTASTITTFSEVWNAGGKYAVDVLSMPDDTNPNRNYDFLDMTSITASDWARVAVNTNLTAGQLGRGDSQTHIWDWLIAETDTGSFNAAKLLLQINPVTDVPSYKFDLVEKPYGTGGSRLYLEYNYSAVPEATTMILGFLATAPIMMHRRRRKVDTATA